MKFSSIYDFPGGRLPRRQNGARVYAEINDERLGSRAAAGCGTEVHQFVVVDPVEEFLQSKTNRPAGGVGAA